VQDPEPRRGDGGAAGFLPRRRQEGLGTYHRLQDKDAVAHLLRQGWDTPVSALAGYSASRKMAAS
jgi:hypothetical protein